MIKKARTGVLSLVGGGEESVERLHAALGYFHDTFVFTRTQLAEEIVYRIHMHAVVGDFVVQVGE